MLASLQIILVTAQSGNVEPPVFKILLKFMMMILNESSKNAQHETSNKCFGEVLDHMFRFDCQFVFASSLIII